MKIRRQDPPVNPVSLSLLVSAPWLNYRLWSSATMSSLNLS